MIACPPEQVATDCAAADIPGPQAAGTVRLSLLVSEASDSPVLVQLATEGAEGSCDSEEGSVGSHLSAESISSQAGSSNSPQPPAAGQDVGATVPADLTGSSDGDAWLAELPAAPTAPVIIRPAGVTARGVPSYADRGVSNSSSVPNSAARGALQDII